MPLRFHQIHTQFFGGVRNKPIFIRSSLCCFSKNPVNRQVWVVLSMQIRYLDGSYRPGGQFYDSLPKEEGPKRFSTSQTLLHELLGAEVP